MILWCDGAHAPEENMRRDSALLAAAAAGPGRPPVLRLFRFAPPGVTLGANQRPER
jgi:lipoate-protein ligase A